MGETVRAHVVLPKSLVEAVDELVGQRRRSHFVEEAVQDKLRHERQRRAIDDLIASGGVLDKDAHPEWATAEQTSEWVRTLRREADAGTMRKVGRDH